MGGRASLNSRVIMEGWFACGRCYGTSFLFFSTLFSSCSVEFFFRLHVDCTNLLFVIRVEKPITDHSGDSPLDLEKCKMV